MFREWRRDLPVVLFIGLNPSTADHRDDDPTIRRCIDFAQQWGFGRLWVANLFAWRSTEPRGLLTAAEPIGRRNNHWLSHLTKLADRTIVAWGVHGSYLNRAATVLNRLSDPHHLGLTRDGSPRHPLYLRRDCIPKRLQSLGTFEKHTAFELPSKK